MTDISERVIDESEKQVSMANGEYALQPKHFMPVVGLRAYVKEHPIIDFTTVFERSDWQEGSKLRMQRVDRTAVLFAYNVNFIGLPLLSIFYFASQT